jgi:hypothetical protein
MMITFNLIKTTDGCLSAAKAQQDNREHIIINSSAIHHKIIIEQTIMIVGFLQS